MDYEKAYKQALERAKNLKEMYPQDAAGYEEVFPELRESEDERIRKAIIKGVSQIRTRPGEITQEQMLGWLEKQKEQIPYIDFVIKPHKGDDNNPYDMRVSEAQEYAIKRGFGIPFNDGEVYVDERHITQTIGNILRWADDHPKEQKPISQEDMPYVTDEHFYEREPADSFKYKLAEYMTKNCTKKESPYGYSYSINSESILEMAKEELIKRGELQKSVEWSERHIADVFEKVGLAKIVREQGNDNLTNALQSAMIELASPVEWSEEDEKIRKFLIDLVSTMNWRVGWPEDKVEEEKVKCLSWLKSLRPVKQELSEKDRKILDDVSHILAGLNYKQVAQDYKQAVENLLSLRPQWKPTEEQMDALAYAIQILDDGLSPKAAKAGEELEGIREHFKKL